MMKEAAFTLLYLAPELISEEASFNSKIKSWASDIYDLGIGAFQLLFPEEPIQFGHNGVQHLEDVKSKRWMPNTKTEFPKESKEDNFHQLVKQCLVWEPEKRIRAHNVTIWAQKIFEVCFSFSF